MTIGEVAVFALGGDRFGVAWPDGERDVEGVSVTRRLAHELAARRRKEARTKFTVRAS